MPPASPHILEQYPAHDEHEREERRPRHALAKGNGGYIQTASLDAFFRTSTENSPRSPCCASLFLPHSDENVCADQPTSFQPWFPGHTKGSLLCPSKQSMR